MGSKNSGRPGGNPGLGPGPGRKPKRPQRRNSEAVYISPDLRQLIQAACGDQDWREFLEILIWRNCQN